MLINPQCTSPSRPLPPHQTLPYTQLPPLRPLPVSRSTPNVPPVLLHLPPSPAQLVSNCSGQKSPPFSPHTRFINKSCPSKHKNPTFLTILFLHHYGRSHHCVLPPFLQIQQWALSLGYISRRRAAELEYVCIKMGVMPSYGTPTHVRKAFFSAALLSCCIILPTTPTISLFTLFAEPAVGKA